MDVLDFFLIFEFSTAVHFNVLASHHRVALVLFRSGANGE
jgi:hypothetical protein